MLGPWVGLGRVKARPRLQSRAIVIPLTQTGGRQHACCHVWGGTVGEHRLQNVVGEGQGDDSQGSGVHDEDSTPQQEETSED